METINIITSKQTITFCVEEFESDIILEKLLRIDFNNLESEINNLPLIIAKASWLLAESSEKEREEELNVKVYSAHFREQKREELSKKELTVQKLDDLLLLDDIYQMKKRSYIFAMKQKEIVEGIFWSLKSKLDIITKQMNLTNN